jgi:hypothetical protein
MFVTNTNRGYTRKGEQRASGLFLILFSPNPYRTGEIRAAVRHIRLTQCGHWMMGSAQVGAKRITLSGSYGSDGLLVACPSPEMWDALVPLPAELFAAWNTGGGHNSAGSEAPAMRKWALENLTALRRAGSCARQKENS